MNVLTLVIILVAAVLIVALRQFEMQYTTAEWTLKTYIAVIALVFLFVGIVSGLMLRRSRRTGLSDDEERQLYVLHDDHDADHDVEHHLSQSIAQAKPTNGHLSTRETELMRLVALGHSNKEIADKLFLSEHTVKKHLNNIFSKLQVERRTQAVQKARELGIIGV